MPRERNRYRDRRSVSYSSDSSCDRKKSRSKHKRKSRSKDRSESSYKRRRSNSRSRRRRSYSRSSSRDRYDRSRKSPKSKSKKYRRSSSRDRSLSRSRSRSRSRYSTSKQRSQRSTRSNSSENDKPVIPRLTEEDIKLAKAIKAAEAAGLTMTKIPTYEYKDVEVREDMPTITDRNLLEEINSDSFVQKSFTSSKNKKKQNIVIDLNTDKVTMPVLNTPKDDSIINFKVSFNILLIHLFQLISFHICLFWVGRDYGMPMTPFITYKFHVNCINGLSNLNL